MNSVFFVSETWILDSTVSGIPDFQALYCGFQSPGLRIPQEKKFSYSGIRIPLHGVTSSSALMDIFRGTVSTSPLTYPFPLLDMFESTRSFQNLRKIQLEKLAKRSFILTRIKRRKKAICICMRILVPISLISIVKTSKKQF